MDRLLEVSPLLNRRSVLLSLAAWCVSGQTQDKDKTKEKDKDAAAKPAPTVYTPGGDVKAPKVVHYVEPAFSEVTKEAFVDGVVKLRIVVTPDGLPTEIEVVRSLNSEEDHNAIDAVKQWRFQPGTKGGEAVHVRVNVEIAFHLM